MFHFSVMNEDASVGEVSAERAGLYWHLRASCDVPDGLWRLYAAAPGASPCKIGVLQPCGGRFVLEKRISCRSLPLNDQTIFTLTPQRLPDSIPFCPQMPFPDMSRFCQYRVEDGPAGQILKKGTVL